MTECMDCGFSGKLLKRTIGAHKYSEGGLDNITLIDSVIEYSCPDCGEILYEYPKLSLLHEVIARMLVLKKDKLTNKELIFLRKVLGYDADTFAELIAKSYQYYGKCESGAQPMTKEMDRLVRLTYLSHNRPDRDYDEKDSKIHKRLIDREMYDFKKLKFSYIPRKHNWSSNNYHP